MRASHQERAPGPRRSPSTPTAVTRRPGTASIGGPATPRAGGDARGKWGLNYLRTIIVWFTFFISLFDGSVSVYEVHNNGWAYNLGFVIGAATLHGGGGAAAARRRRRRRD